MPRPGGLASIERIGTDPAYITWLGHATVLVALDGVRLVTDPVLRKRVGPLVRMAPPPRPDETAGVEAVLLSHLHYDHADPPSLRRLGTSTRVIAPRGAGPWLAGRGLRNVQELDAGSALSVGPLRIEAIPATHDGRRRPLGVSAAPIGFVVRGSSSVYFAGDTDLFPGMADLGGVIDVALLPVAGWGPTLPAGHLDPARAATAARLIGPRVAIPIHWGTFGLPLRVLRRGDPDRPPHEFARLVSREAPRVDVRVPKPGHRVALTPLSRAATA